MKPPIREIADDFHMITLPMPFSLRQVNVFVLIHDGRVALFDTGLDFPDAYSALEASFRSLGVRLKDVEHIFLSHFHLDHCGAASRIKEISGAVIHMSRIDYETMMRYNHDSAHADRVRDFCIQHGFTGDGIEALAESISQVKTRAVPFEVEDFLVPHREVELFDARLEVIPTAGHTRGHVCFFFKELSLLLSGDHILPHMSPNLSPDLYAPCFSPLEWFMDSLETARTLPVRAVYPAHGMPFSRLEERVKSIKRYHEERTRLVLDSTVRGPKSAFEITVELSGGLLQGLDKLLSLNETCAYLMELERAKKIVGLRKGKTRLFSSV